MQNTLIFLLALIVNWRMLGSVGYHAFSELPIFVNLCKNTFGFTIACEKEEIVDFAKQKLHGG